MMRESKSSKLGPLEEGPDVQSHVVVEDEACAHRPKSWDLCAGVMKFDWTQVNVHATVPLCPPWDALSKAVYADEATPAW